MEVYVEVRVLDETQSLCPKCLSPIQAKVVTDGIKVYMEKTCRNHGAFKALLWSDLSLYERTLKFTRKGRLPRFRVNTKRGCPYDCGLCSHHEQHTCLAIIEVTDACNQLCPVCLADSRSLSTWEPTLDELKDAIKELLRQEGGPTAIQFSGGEPTLRKDLPDIVATARDLGFKCIEVDTNGIELAKNPRLIKELAESGLSGVYLQFDGLTSDVYFTLRGADLLRIKERAIKGCIDEELSVTLAMTVVKGVNDGQLWDVVKYAISVRAIGVNFQPFAALGRYPPSLFDPFDRTTISDVQIKVEEQSGGAVKALDFVPIPCPDPRCSSLVYACYDEERRIKVINRLADMEELIDKYSLKDRFIEFDELIKSIVSELCCLEAYLGECRPQDLGSQLRLLLEHLKPQGFFSIGCHFAQDVWTVDLKRLKKCCVHELRKQGCLVPFCLFNITAIDGAKLYRGNKL
ncbi:MAG: radical SAM protein [Candidatus Nezhaarchaeales archaeon]